MNVTPTSGPMARSNTHHDRDTTSSRHSFLTSHRKADLREGKKHLLEIVARCRRSWLRRRERRQFPDRPLAARAPAAQEHEAIADARRVLDLVDRQEHGAARGGE